MFYICYTLYEDFRIILTLEGILNMKTMVHPAERAKAMRQKAMNMAIKRKEEYLGARVPKALKDKVINRAEELGIPVSLLLRKVLEEVFAEEQTILKLENIKSVVAEQASVAKSYDDILGWKEIQLNKACDCDACGARQMAGTEVFMGIGTGSNNPVLCNKCKDKIIIHNNA